MNADSELSQIRHSGSIQLQSVDHGADGFLTVAEYQRSIPFRINRVYFIAGVSNPDIVRGKHAHKALQQAIFCIKGSFKLDLDDGTTQVSVLMDRPDRGVYLGPLLWHTMHSFTPDCVILVLASEIYDESDYLRKYDDFLAYIAQHEDAADH
jgi:hypothetical protein